MLQQHHFIKIHVSLIKTSGIDLIQLQVSNLPLAGSNSSTALWGNDQHLLASCAAKSVFAGKSHIYPQISISI